MHRRIVWTLGVTWALIFGSEVLAAPLFESHEPLALRLAGSLHEVIRDRSEDPEEKDMILTLPDGRVLDVEVRQRGNFRRQRKICRFPPLRLDLDKDQVDGTVFEDQNKLKLVTHCGKANKYQQYVFKEYLAYRLFNLLTDASFKVRLVKIEYADTFGKQNTTRFGFLIEHVSSVAERLRAAHVEPKSISYTALDEPAATLVSVFQYFIGNLDFSLIRARADEDCCHNVKLFESSPGVYLPVPYDFDMSGIVDTRYAGPPAALAKTYRLRSVTDRLYRGFCSEPGLLQEVLAKFTANRDSIYALIDSESLLAKREMRHVRRFVDDFYEDIEDTDSIERHLVRRMRGC